jgi:hypothetical protein
MSILIILGSLALCFMACSIAILLPLAALEAEKINKENKDK